MRISDWSSDVCSSDLPGRGARCADGRRRLVEILDRVCEADRHTAIIEIAYANGPRPRLALALFKAAGVAADETLIDPSLGLIAQVVVDTGDDDDQAIARKIGRAHV